MTNSLKLQYHGDFSPQYSYGQTWQHIDRENKEILGTATAFVKPTRPRDADSAVRFNHQVPTLHQASTYRLFTISPESFKNALRLHVDRMGKLLQKRIGLSILPNAEGHHNLKSKSLVLKNEVQEDFIKNIWHINAEGIQGREFRKIMRNSKENFEELSLYNALGALIKKQTPKVITNLSASCYPMDTSGGLTIGSLDPNSSIEEFLESMFGPSQLVYSGDKENPTVKKIDLGMLFVIKSKSKGWEFYHCNKNDFQNFSSELKDRYKSDEEVSIKLITYIDAVQEKNGSKVALQLDTKNQFRSNEYQSLEEFITAVQNIPAANTQIFFESKPASNPTNIMLTDSAMDLGLPPSSTYFKGKNLKAETRG